MLLNHAANGHDNAKTIEKMWRSEVKLIHKGKQDWFKTGFKIAVSSLSRLLELVIEVFCSRVYNVCMHPLAKHIPP